MCEYAYSRVFGSMKLYAMPVFEYEYRADERGEEAAAKRWRERAEELTQIIATNEEISK